ncbi:putative RNase H-like nuclease [Breoghania corrubedonensis]|uniref:Putative RNase H-like nuclease n=1 Tax=Breoghania corrubedonensis TaxID=665038 RepID=A0A2T5VI87_9HYPH|nr:putative RNase H-like nuclease [Breoghania corrubedonensis]
MLRNGAADPAPRIALLGNFSGLLALDPAPAVFAVDMPIGLAGRSGLGGRGPERHVRRHLGARQSSVFSLPARASVMCEDYREACRVALATSEPPRKVSKQAFNLFPKIREIDALMTPELEARVYEVHPELGFWRLNGGTEMSLPKKIRNEGSMPGIEQRQALLECHGFPASFWRQPRPSGVGADDLVDAAVNAVIAERIWKGEAQAFPHDFERDAKGLRMAIWA